MSALRCRGGDFDSLETCADVTGRDLFAAHCADFEDERDNLAGVCEALFDGFALRVCLRKGGDDYREAAFRFWFKDHGVRTWRVSHES